jgi:hypothetical protein
MMKQMPKGWKFARFGYIGPEFKEPSYEEIQKKVSDLLSKATRGTPWHGKWGSTHIPIVVDGQIVGEIWEDVDLKELKPAAYWLGKWGYKVELVKDGRVIGFLWLQ